MAIIHNGDQYGIPIAIGLNGVAVTPSNVTDVRVCIGETMESYDGGDGVLTFDDATQTWQFWLDESMSKDLERETQVQVGVKQTNEWAYSDVTYLGVGGSIITESWADEND